MLKCSAYARWPKYAIDKMAVAKREKGGRAVDDRYLQQLVLLISLYSLVELAGSFLPSVV